MRMLFAFAVLGFASSVALAGKFNKVLSIGDVAPSWEGLPGTDGKEHALADFKDKDVIVVVFTCNTCPVAEAYEPRIIAFAKANPNVGVVAINVNTAKEDALPAMKMRAEKKRFNYPYLHDASQEIARKYGAKYTPEFFVLDKDRKIAYMGAMDDKSPPGEAKAKHLEAAVKAVLDGKKASTAETSAAAGCGIKFNPKKDD
ncbi:MAG: thioredoxin family protein [Gemmataceae bacterium]